MAGSLVRSVRTRFVVPLAVAGLLAGALAVPAQAAAPPSCLDAMPVTEVVAGLTGHGLTVSQGTVPDSFTAVVDGRATDGIAPGIDMIIAHLDSSAMETAGGVWSGMSGSPVYDDESGRLIGAVAYGLSFGPSKIAGITPAESMGADLLERSAAAQPIARTVSLPPELRRRIAATGAATPAQLASGMTRLPMPLAVSGGLTDNRLDELVQRLHLTDVRPYAAAAPGVGVGDPADIVPGGNFAAAMSTGDLTMAGVGTTTAVCDGEALAFGHPMNFSGPATMTEHGADALTIQDDPTLAPFKIANLTGVVGTVDQDRRVGLHAQAGVFPDSTAVTSLVESGTRSRLGQTDVTFMPFLPDLAAFHLLANFDRVFDQIGPGSATVGWTVTGKRADGSDWELSRDNRFASQFDISFESIFELADTLFELQGNEAEDVTITGVDADVDIDGTYRSYRIDRVLARDARGRFVPLSEDGSFPVVAGTQLNLRVELLPYKGIGSPRTETVQVTVPASARGGFGSLSVFGGLEGGGFGEEFGSAAGAKPAAAGATSTGFDDLLEEIAARPRNDDVVATLDIDAPRAPGGFVSRTGHSTVDQVVTGLGFFPVEVVAPERVRAGHVRAGNWTLGESLASGPVSRRFTFGTPGDVPLMGDWDGNGSVTPAVFRDGTWTIRDKWRSPAVRSFTFGQPGDQPVMGDWDGNGSDDVGVFRQGEWLLRSTAGPGTPPIDSFMLGSPGARPVAGDWNGDGIDTVGTYAAGAWSVADANESTAATRDFRLGRAGDKPVVGDWDADGVSEPGVYRAGRWRLSRRTFGGPVSITFDFGGRKGSPVVWR